MPISLNACSSALSLESSTGSTRFPPSSAALLLLSSSPFSSAVNGTPVSASSLRIGIPGPSSELSSTFDLVTSSLLRVVDRLPYQNAKVHNESTKSTPSPIPIPITALAVVDKPPCFEGTEGDEPVVMLPEPEVLVPELGSGVLELRPAVLAFGTAVPPFELDVPLEFGLDDVETGIDVLVSALDVLVRVLVEDEAGSGTRVVVLGDAELLIIVEGGEPDEEAAPIGMQSGRVKSSGQLPDPQ